jgi:hypothetical protein
MLADFQQRFESLHLLCVHVIHAMRYVAVTEVMRVTACLKWKAATFPAHQHNLRDTQGKQPMRK